MTQELIEAFLAIYEYRNITTAAQHLFTTQSTVSHRLQLLETELGVTLFDRRRGRRSIETTAAGEQFAGVAHQWMVLFDATQEAVHTPYRMEIVIGGTDIINCFSFAPFYQAFIERHPELQLRTRTHHSDELYHMVENQQVDIAFVFSEFDYPDVTSQPLYQEPMYLLCHETSSYHDGMPLSDLPAEQEIYLRWGEDYAVWHNRHWPSKRYLVHTGTEVQALSYLTIPERWAIVPWSVYESMSFPAALKCLRLKEMPPPRTCYQISNRNPLPKTKRVIKPFTEELHAFIHDLQATGLFMNTAL